MSETETHMGQRLVSSPPNTLHPNQPDYQRPDPHPDDAYQPAPVTVDGTVVEQAHATFENAKAQYEKFLESIPRERYSAKGLQEQIAGFSDTAAAKAVDRAVEQVRERADTAVAQVDKIKRGLSPNGDVAAELRATRYWNRTAAVLDSAKEGAFGAAQKLIANADREQLGTLLQELPSYLQAHGQPSDWIDTAVGQVVPEYAEAQSRRQKAQQALLIAERNRKSLQTSFANGYSSSILTDGRQKYDPDK